MRIVPIEWWSRNCLTDLRQLKIAGHPEQVPLNEKAPQSGALAEPSSGLEPETPSSP
jgi:hypothetical protein